MGHEANFVASSRQRSGGGHVARRADNPSEISRHLGTAPEVRPYLRMRPFARPLFVSSRHQRIFSDGIRPHFLVCL